MGAGVPSAPYGEITLPPDLPPPLEPHARPPAESPSAEAFRRRRGDRAAQALVSPWSASRARRVRVVALVLVIVGPLLGTLLALVLVPADPSDVVSVDGDRRVDLAVEATVRSIDAATGEMSVRLVLAVPRASALFAEGGSLRRAVTLYVSDAAGQAVRELPAGQPPGAAGITVALTGSRATRYPVDRYRGTLLVLARVGVGDGDTGRTEPDDGDAGTPITVGLSLRSNDPLFAARALDAVSTDDAAVVDLQVQRRWTVIGWAAFFVLVCWLLAISAASIGWTTVVHGLASPVWAWAFLIGVLFALPPLRDNLPGDPPGGALIDFAAYYWAVGIVTLTLVAMIGSWNIRVRRFPASPDAPRP